MIVLTIEYSSFATRRPQAKICVLDFLRVALARRNKFNERVCVNATLHIFLTLTSLYL